MNVRMTPAIIVIALLGSVAGSAREVSLLNFSDDASPVNSQIARLAKAKPREAIAEAMRARFASRAEMPDGILASDHISVQDEQNLLTDLISGDGIPPATPCMGATYTPTWWLPTRVESRRVRYFFAVARIACEEGLPTELLDAVVAQESGYNPLALSPAGAMGIMQIMPGTARSMGLIFPYDAFENLRSGARYLRQQLDRFGRTDLALAAYNAGPERRSLVYGYVPAISETLNYVRTITTNWARLAEQGRTRLAGERKARNERSISALAAAHAAGYRDVDLIRYDPLH